MRESDELDENNARPTRRRPREPAGDGNGTELVKILASSSVTFAITAEGTYRSD
jgi:hypothetical protein